MKRVVMVSIGGAAAMAATAVAALGPPSAPGWEETSGSGGAFIVGKFADRTPDALSTKTKEADQATAEADEPTKEAPTEPGETATSELKETRTPEPTKEVATPTPGVPRKETLVPMPPKPIPTEPGPTLEPKPTETKEPRPIATKPAPTKPVPTKEPTKEVPKPVTNVGDVDVAANGVAGSR